MTDQTAWLVEWPASDNMPARWWHPVRGWCIDANKAAWFMRKEDAQGFIDNRNFVEGITTTEHMFIGDTND